MVSYPPLSGEFGAAQLALSLGAALRERGHEVELWSPGSPPAGTPWYESWRWQRQQLEEHLARSAPFDAVDAPPVAVSHRVAQAAPAIARSVQPDLSYLWCGLRAQARSWPPSVRLPLHAALDLVLATAVVRGWNRARRVLALGSHERLWLASRFPRLRPKLGHYLCAPCTETRDAINAVRRDRCRPAGAHGLRFLWIGRWAPHKGTRALVRFLRDRAASHPDDRFTIAGCGAEAEPHLPEPLVASGRLRVVPRFSRDELPSLLADHDVGLFTSEAEGWGLSISEMIESGMPVSATHTGAVDDLQPLVPNAFLPFPPPPGLSPETLPEVGALDLYLKTVRWPEIARRYEEEMLLPLAGRTTRRSGQGQPVRAPMEPLHILSLTNTPADPATGSGYVIVGSARELRSRGHRVRVLDPSQYEPFRDLRRARQYKQALGMAVRSAREVRQTSPDVVELWGGEGWLAAHRLRRRRNRRFLLVARSNGLEPHHTAHLSAARRTGELSPRRWYQLDQTALLERTFRAVDALVTVSEFDRAFALDRGYLPPDRVLSLPNPLPDRYLDVPTFDPSERRQVIGFCGSWLPAKGTHVLREALPKVLREFSDWRLLLVGVGADFRPREHFPADLVDRIDIVARADRNAELVSIYQSIALLIMPSIYESFGLVAAEAMACSAPVLGPSTGLLASLEPDREFLLLPDRRPESLVGALRRAILNPALRATVGAGGHRAVQNLRWDRGMDRLETAYNRWLTELRDDEDPPDHP